MNIIFADSKRLDNRPSGSPTPHRQIKYLNLKKKKNSIVFNTYAVKPSTVNKTF
jgi:hypothetical protein